MRNSPMRGVLAGTALAVSLAMLAPVMPLADVGRASPAAHGQLDGMSFAGSFGVEGKPGDRKDILYFRNGHFWSDICVPCGFAPAKYWVRMEGDTIHFRGEMPSGDRGTFYYTGTVRNGHMSARVNWRKKRWYWSIDRDFRFQGKLVDAPVSESVASVTRRAASVDPDCPL